MDMGTSSLGGPGCYLGFFGIPWNLPLWEALVVTSAFLP